MKNHAASAVYLVGLILLLGLATLVEPMTKKTGNPVDNCPQAGEPGAHFDLATGVLYDANYRPVCFWQAEGYWIPTNGPRFYHGQGGLVMDRVTEKLYHPTGTPEYFWDMDFLAYAYQPYPPVPPWRPNRPGWLVVALALIIATLLREEWRERRVPSVGIGAESLPPWFWVVAHT